MFDFCCHFTFFVLFSVVLQLEAYRIKSFVVIFIYFFSSLKPSVPMIAWRICCMRAFIVLNLCLSQKYCDWRSMNQRIKKKKNKRWNEMSWGEVAKKPNSYEIYCLNAIKYLLDVVSPRVFSASSSSSLFFVHVFGSGSFGYCRYELANNAHTARHTETHKHTQKIMMFRTFASLGPCVSAFSSNTYPMYLFKICTANGTNEEKKRRRRKKKLVYTRVSPVWRATYTQTYIFACDDTEKTEGQNFGRDLTFLVRFCVSLSFFFIVWWANRIVAVVV